VPERYPAARQKPPPLELERHVAVCPRGSQIALRQIEDGAWWAGMWFLPMAATRDALADLCPGGHLVGKFRHTVTRHRITFYVYTAPLPDGWPLRDPTSVPVPAPVRKALAMLEPSHELIEVGA
jgi:adenine-specific DNA glycosylase